MNYREYLLSIWNFWPPFLFSGIKVVKKSKDFRHITAKLKLRFWSANFVGTQYGGSLFSMSDAFYMVMLMKNLGSEYSVWDKAATIRYINPGKTDVTAEFTLSQEEIDDIKKKVNEQGRLHWQKTVEIKDAHGKIVAEVDKTISIKKKQPKAAS
jgi:acyl-coenzyme A thioesterase PaaI-like protein